MKLQMMILAFACLLMTFSAQATQLKCDAECRQRIMQKDSKPAELKTLAKIMKDFRSLNLKKGTGEGKKALYIIDLIKSNRFSFEANNPNPWDFEGKMSGQALKLLRLQLNNNTSASKCRRTTLKTDVSDFFFITQNTDIVELANISLDSSERYISKFEQSCLESVLVDPVLKVVEDRKEHLRRAFNFQ